jgi:NADH dehydrogenase
VTQNIIIAGTGFAGVWAAVSAARAVSLAGKEDAVRITVVSPVAELHIRPRLYETAFEEFSPDIAPLLKAVGVEHLAGYVQTIDEAARTVSVKRVADGEVTVLPYDRFVLATGSQLVQPRIPGLSKHSFNVDQLAGAKALDAHLRALAGKPESAARNTVVVAGAGFTGIETAAEMPERLREILGHDTKVRVVLLEAAPDVGPDLGPGPRPLIEEALSELGVEVITAAAAATIDEGGVTTVDGRRIESLTVIWTAGQRANPLAAQVGRHHDRLGRVPADAFLKAKGVSDIFVTGDTAHAATDDLGHTAMMCCQHALSLGRVAGHNAAAELVGLPTHPYSQVKYVTCLDLGPWGAIYCEGWDRQVKFSRAEGKAIKRDINTKWIYPPKADREAAFAVANPDFVIVP